MSEIDFIKYEKQVEEYHRQYEDFLRQKNFKSAEELLEKEIETRKFLRDNRGLDKDQAYYAICLNNMGLLKSELEDFEESERYLLLALEEVENAIEEKPDSDKYLALSAAYNNLGGVMDHLKEYERSIKYYIEGIWILENQVDQEVPERFSRLRLLYGSAAYVLEKLKDLKGSEHYFRRAVEYQEDLISLRADFQDLWDLAQIYDCLGLFLDSHGRYEEANSFYLKVIEIREELLNQRSLRIDYENLASNYQALAFNLQLLEQKEEAGKYRKKAEKIIRQQHLKELKEKPSFQTVWSYLKDRFF